MMLSMLLLADSRLSYRDLADKLGLSVNAVHKRIQSLQESGIIRAFVAKVSLYALGGIALWVFGRSETALSKIHEQLGKHGSIFWVGIAGGNFLYVGAYLRDVSELEPFVDYLRKEAKMPDPTVGILDSSIGPSETSGQGAPVSPSLDALDYQIVNALRRDSRKAVSDISEELGVTTKTLRRRLSRLIEDKAIELTIDWYPDSSNDIMTVFHLQLKPTANRREVVPLLINKYWPRALLFEIFSNLPNRIICIVWSRTMKELKEIREGFEGEGFFDAIVPNILYTGYIFETWRDKLVVERGAPSGRKLK